MITILLYITVTVKKRVSKMIKRGKSTLLLQRVSILLLIILSSCADNSLTIPEEENILRIEFSQGHDYDSSSVILGEYNVEYANPISLKNAFRINLNYEADSVNIIIKGEDNNESTLFLFFESSIIGSNFSPIKVNDTLRLRSYPNKLRYNGELLIFSFNEILQNSDDTLSIIIEIDSIREQFQYTTQNHILEFNPSLHINTDKFNLNSELDGYQIEFATKEKKQPFLPIVINNNEDRWASFAVNIEFNGFYRMMSFTNLNDKKDFYIMMLEYLSD